MDRTLFTLKNIRRSVLLLTILSLLQAAATIAQAWWLASSVVLMFRGGTWQEAIPPLLLFLGAYLVRFTSIWLSKIISGRYAEQTSTSLQSELMRKLLELGPRYAASRGSGQLITLLIDGVIRFRTYLELFVPRMIDMVFVTLPILITVYVLDFISGLILTFTLPVLIAFFILLGYAARRFADRQYKSYQVLARHFTDVLRGLETLRLLGRSRDFAGSVQQVSDRFRRATMRTLRVAFLSSFALDFFSTLSVAFVAVGLGLRLIDGNIDLLPALAVLLLAPDYYQPVRNLGSDYHASLDGKEAWQTIREILEEDQSLMKLDALEAPPELDALNDPIILEGLCVESEDSEQARLTEISIHLDGSKRKVGIVGASGAGKTTLLHILSGQLQPDAGKIQIGDRPLTDEMRAAWQLRSAYIPQHPYVFSASLADNIRFYEPEASEEQIEQVLADVGLAELVQSLPAGIHEPIGEGGRSLSGGQAQRIALARALIGKRDVLLLDEPTAHLDIETEWELKRTMLPIMEGRRVFLATHRLHWMKEMDWVLVLENGRLVEQGTHEELIQRKGVYYALLEAHAAGGGRR